MRIEQEKVEFFMRRHKLPVNSRPTLVDRELAMKRYDYMREELEEYRTAVLDDNLVGIADALADLQYTVLGTNVTHGIDARPVFDEVHRSNMTKTPLDPVTGKGGKGDGFSPARVPEVLLMQMLHQEEMS